MMNPPPFPAAAMWCLVYFTELFRSSNLRNRHGHASADAHHIAEDLLHLPMSASSNIVLVLDELNARIFRRSPWARPFQLTSCCLKCPALADSGVRPVYIRLQIKDGLLARFHPGTGVVKGLFGVDSRVLSGHQLYNREEWHSIRRPKCYRLLKPVYSLFVIFRTCRSH